MLGSQSSRSLWLAYIGLVLTPLFWAGNAVVARGIAGEVPPLSMSFYRWLLALLLVLPFGLPTVWRQRQVVWEHWRSILVLATFSVGAFNSLLYFAAVTTSATNIALINTTIPVMVALLAWLLLGERTHLPQAVGILLAIAGIVIVVARGRWQTLVALGGQPGDLIMVLAVFCWGLFSVLLRRQSVPLTPVAFLTVQIAFGTLAILPFYLIDLCFFSGGFEVTRSRLLALGYFAIFPGILAYGFWNHAVHQVGPGRAALFMYLVPIFAAIMAMAFLNEQIGWFHIAGGGFIMAGLFLATRSGRPR